MFSVKEFVKDYPNGPYITFTCVALRSSHFKGMISWSPSIGIILHVESSLAFGDSKIAYLEDAFEIYEYIFWLQVSMNHSVFYQIHHSIHNLSKVVNCFFLPNRPSFLHELPQITRTLLCDYIDVFLALHYLYRLKNMLPCHLLQNMYFIQEHLLSLLLLNAQMLCIYAYVPDLLIIFTATTSPIP